MKRDRHRIERNHWPLWTALFVAFCILPGLALARLAKRVDPEYLAGYLVLVWLVTALAYWMDKRRARTEAWRTPESTLHLMELIGGWGSAFWAQRFFRHKIRKVSYQVSFWMIALLHQLLAFDYLRGWEVSARLVNGILALVR